MILLRTTAHQRHSMWIPEESLHFYQTSCSKPGRSFVPSNMVVAEAVVYDNPAAQIQFQQLSGPAWGGIPWRSRWFVQRQQSSQVSPTWNYPVLFVPKHAYANCRDVAQVSRFTSCRVVRRENCMQWTTKNHLLRTMVEMFRHFTFPKWIPPCKRLVSRFVVIFIIE